jgi:SAM-dependent methyltransferase
MVNLRAEAAVPIFAHNIHLANAAPIFPEASMSDGSENKTASHYTLQWGESFGFADFVTADPEAAMAMPGRQLGWPDLFERIRAEGARRTVVVYDAGCGFGDVMRQLCAEPIPPYLHYVGVDIRDGLEEMAQFGNAQLLKHDIAEPLREGSTFDFIICRATLHHTPDPAATYSILASQLKPAGVLAVSVYSKKSPMREAIDDALRQRIVRMSNDDAFALARQFTLFGHDLQKSSGTVRILQDLPFLQIKAGEYSIHSFIYDHFMKCWFNESWGAERSDIVNFDWYHPPHAHRFSMDEMMAFAYANNLKVVKSVSIKAQHYLEAQS